jgi:cold shock CspA family protein
MKNRIFISYAREDLPTADRLYKDLKATGLTPWLDEHELHPGDNWATEIEIAIGHCAYFIALLSRRSVNKEGHVQKEVRQALDRVLRIPEGQPFIIPVRLDECEPRFKDLNKFHRVDLFRDYDDCVAKLIRVFEYVEKEKPAIIYMEEYPRIGHVVRILESGFGFITPAYKGKDLFFHREELRDLSFDDLNEGMMISYFLARGPRGVVAVNITRV